MGYARAFRVAAPARRAGTATRGRDGGRERTGDRGGADNSSALARVTELQQAVGNRAVSQLLATYAGGGSGASVSLHGKTHGDYDGGSSKVSGINATRARGCDCEGDDPCYRVSGVLTITYHVDPVIEMPDVPAGLSKCQEQRVRDFLRNVLGPHEQEHARRIRTYDGTTVRPFAEKGCGREAAMDAARAETQQMHDTESADRAAKADALSLAIDPFDKKIDLDCKDS